MRKSLVIAAVSFLAFKANAQQIPLSSQYYVNKFILNPAFTGNKEEANAFLTHRSQWTGVQGAPQTSYLTIDGPVDKKNIGLGLNLFSDVTDISSRTGAYGAYSYKLSLKEDHHLRFGLAVGVIDYKLDFSRAVYRDKMDPYLMSQTVHKTVFNADFGLAYNWKQLEVGFAIPQMLGNKVNYNSNNSDIFYRVERHYVGSAKYVVDVIKDKEITAYPLIVVRAAKGAPLQYDVNGIIDWKKIGWFGVSYRSAYAVGLSAGVRYKGLSVGYAYDMGIAGIKSYSGPTNEFLLGFTFGGGKSQEEDQVSNAKLNEIDQKNAALQESINKLQTQGDTNTAEIAKVKGELENLKLETRDIVRVNSKNDFADETGQSPEAGYYIVIGTFSSVDNATKMKAIHVTRGYSNAHVVQNTKTKLYHVYVIRALTKEDVLLELPKLRAEYPDAWIQKLE